MFSYEEAGLCFDDMVRRSKEADTDVVARVLAGVQMVRVQLRMEMNYKNSTSRANQLELSGKVIKKPGQGDIDGMVSSLGTNMNMVGANEFDVAQQGRRIHRCSRNISRCSWYEHCNGQTRSHFDLE